MYLSRITLIMPGVKNKIAPTLKERARAILPIQREGSID
jgi:hypothetical protein